MIDPMLVPRSLPTMVDSILIDRKARHQVKIIVQGDDEEGDHLVYNPIMELWVVSPF